MEFAKNASALHKKTGEILLLTSPFKGCTLRQEVPVSELFPSYSNNRDKYDWVIPELFVIIECQGIQHFKVQSFGLSAEEAVMAFQAQQFRDKQKEEVAILNGWTFIAIPYLDEKILTAEYLTAAYNKCFNNKDLEKKKKKVKPDWQIKKETEQKDRARIYRKEQYRKNKERLKNGNKRSSTSSSSSSYQKTKGS
jgi:hypothetical protein